MKSFIIKRFLILFTETPATATEKIFFSTRAVHERDPREIKITWNAFNLTSNLAAAVQISLWGYRETTIRPELEYIGLLEVCIYFFLINCNIFVTKMRRVSLRSCYIRFML